MRIEARRIKRKPRRKEIAKAIQYITRERLRSERIHYDSGNNVYFNRELRLGDGDAGIVTIADES